MKQTTAQNKEHKRIRSTDFPDNEEVYKVVKKYRDDNFDVHFGNPIFKNKPVDILIIQTFGQITGDWKTPKKKQL